MTWEQQLLVAVAGGLVAALITAGLSAITVFFTLRHNNESERKADARRLRDDKVARIRKAMEPALNSSLMLSQIVQDTQRIWATETPEARDERHLKMQEEAWPAMNQARVALMLQSSARTIVGLIDNTIVPAFHRYGSAYAFNRAHQGDPDARKELDDQWTKLQEGLAALREESLHVLDELETPI
jgi:hypothetical protein